jgi:hypothetical protein
VIDARSFQADDDTRQLDQLLHQPVTVSGGVGKLLGIEWLAVLADNQDQFLGADINACEEVWLCFLGCFFRLNVVIVVGKNALKKVDYPLVPDPA